MLELSVKRSHKRILIILVLILAAVALSSCGGIETAEWMKRVALDSRAADSLIQKAKIE